MKASDYGSYLRRAEQATSVAALHAIVREARADHPDDPDLEGLDDTFQYYARELLAEGRLRRREARTRDCDERHRDALASTGG